LRTLDTSDRLKRGQRHVQHPSAIQKFAAKPAPRKILDRLLICLGFFGGMVILSGFSTAIEATNSLDFCVSCHEMRDNVFKEYKQSAHYSNRTGVQVTCSDCHVPKDWSHKIIRKLNAANDIYATLVGSVNTKEKFEAKRMEMATREWNAMKKSNSRECRNCHSFPSHEKQ